MYLVVYPDVIFIINFLLDFCLLELLRVILRSQTSWLRRFVASGFGGGMAVLAGINPGMSLMTRFLFLNLFTAAGMLWIMFGKMKCNTLLRRVAVFYVITYSVGGLINSVYYNTQLQVWAFHFGKAVANSPSALLVISVFFAGFLLKGWIIPWMRREVIQVGGIYEVELRYGEYSVCTKGFLDTGNALIDPIAGKAVMVLEEVILKKLLKEEQYEQFLRLRMQIQSTGGVVSGEVMSETLLPVRLIPYHSVGNPHGLMLGILLDYVQVQNKGQLIHNERVTAAICEGELSTDLDYHALLPMDWV